MHFSSLDLIRNLARSLINITKGSSYINKNGENIALSDKDQVAKSKKETRDAASIYMRESVPQARNYLASEKAQQGKPDIRFTPSQWNEFTVQLADELRFIVTHIASSSRAGSMAEGIVFLTFNEVLQRKFDSSSPFYYPESDSSSDTEVVSIPEVSSDIPKDDSPKDSVKPSKSKK